MKKTLFAFLLGSLCLQAMGQETVPVEKEKGNYYEEYHVLRSDKKVKHGSYLQLSKSPLGELFLESSGSFTLGEKSGLWDTYYPQSSQIKTRGYYKNGEKDSVWVHFYPEPNRKKLVKVGSGQETNLEVVSANPTVLATGMYKNGEMSGTWEYYDEAGFLAQTYDHDKGLLTYVSQGSLDELDAGFIGGDLLLQQYLTESFDFYHGFLATNKNTISLNPGMIIFLFTIDEEGRVTDITEIEDSVKNKKLYQRALAATQSLDSKWYPARKGGVPYPVTKTAVFELKIETRHSSVLTDAWSLSSTSHQFSSTVQVR
ncbi:hypothetical protein J0A68_09370 [Algoriphagus sp. H41]|uniref:TonB C-terminal domain-containing protein n=1 Tax=Algoriphagus oliviformis TaxID=2811231 RepID=A0ABS3C3L3_9BACT|nr:hypothetical protein [Algoriphagus oliviformis]MBN7811166.1 hypothetical protein [Algoriphagus oliviformis]